ncbi:MAG: lysophospholipid acyltransferase family protein [Bacteroidales bacterium]|nr:lysophospholipid acyltransferase family protein [Bacteroidales bacterium]
MLKTAFFYFTFWAILIFTAIFFIPYYILKLVGSKKSAKLFVYHISKAWARFILDVNGMSYTSYNRENIPETRSNLVVVSNHQGSFDIPIHISSLPFSVGFIAKHEIKKMPIISVWMIALDCIFINRKKLRESSKKINERIHLKDTNPIFIFPEGTRSKGPKMGAFKPGSLKMLFHEGADVLPVTISGSYKCMELHNNVKSAHVELFYHPVLHSSDYHHDDFNTFNKDLQQIIAKPLTTKK